MIVARWCPTKVLGNVLVLKSDCLHTLVPFHVLDKHLHLQGIWSNQQNWPSTSSMFRLALSGLEKGHYLLKNLCGNWLWAFVHAIGDGNPFNTFHILSKCPLNSHLHALNLSYFMHRTCESMPFCFDSLGQSTFHKPQHTKYNLRCINESPDMVQNQLRTIHDV